MAEMAANLALIDGMAVEFNNHYMADLAAALLANPGHLAALNLAVENLQQGQLHALGLDQDAAEAELVEAGEPEAEQEQDQGGEYFEDNEDIPVDQDAQGFSCDNCDQTFQRLRSLKDHVKSIHLGLRVNCTLCTATFSTRQGKNSHYKSKHRNVAHTCSDCGAKFTTRSTLRRHELTIHAGVVIPCSDCERVFSTKGGLKVHVQAAHLDSRLYICNICMNAFNRSSSLAAHKRTHLGMSFPCEFCPAVFRQNVHLTRHCKTFHLGLRFECDLCGQQCTTQHAVREHIRTQHGY